MAEDVEERMLQLEELSKFISSSYDKINDIVQELGWDKEKLKLQSDCMVACPLNPEHRVPQNSLEKHFKSCSWRREGYHELDVQLPESCGPYSSHANTTVVIGKELQARIIKEAAESTPSGVTDVTNPLELDNRPIPKTSDRLVSSFTAEERLALYDYVVSNTEPPTTVKVEELLLFDARKEEKPRPKTRLEMLIEERNAKRRRISYRNKVHTNRKTQTEILREVIQSQMEVLQEFNNPADSEKSSMENVSRKSKYIEDEEKTISQNKQSRENRAHTYSKHHGRRREMSYYDDNVSGERKKENREDSRHYSDKKYVSKDFKRRLRSPEQQTRKRKEETEDSSSYSSSYRMGRYREENGRSVAEYDGHKSREREHSRHRDRGSSKYRDAGTRGEHSRYKECRDNDRDRKEKHSSSHKRRRDEIEYDEDVYSFKSERSCYEESHVKSREKSKEKGLEDHTPRRKKFKEASDKGKYRKYDSYDDRYYSKHDKHEGGSRHHVFQNNSDEERELDK